MKIASWDLEIEWENGTRELLRNIPNHLATAIDEHLCTVETKADEMTKELFNEEP